ncbi:DUF6507 family protein [Paeniglutamicibacter cryotolerans]|uniref:Uncharacterized protein n=1 Tax=Paeniglutamicibacter cryotolerans TaxID=670079 RepID=A0A839QKS0_9MICC|nr:DUF6507 family protein [Paeniglutamicibacter cryotolerans]MBB2994626.1 hypothetical protein [Paeniglutamicibacter cryotolerans]
MALANWDVNPSAARAVIAGVRGHAESFEPLEKALKASVEDAAASSKSTSIAGALQSTYEGYLAKVAAVAGLSALKVVNQADKIVNAFVDADKTMASIARQAIDEVPSSLANAQ